MCINDKVLTSKENGSITQKCNLLSVNCKDSSLLCPYYSRYMSNQSSIPQNLITTTEWKEWGEKTKMCPYFSNKFNLQLAEIVLLPYAALLSQKVSNQLKLQLEKSVVIIDEGHNLIGALQNAADITVDEIKFSHALNFCVKFHEFLQILLELKPNDQVCINDMTNFESLIFILKSLVSRLSSSNNLEEISPVEFISSCKLENYNFLKLSLYLNVNMSRFFDIFIKNIKSHVNQSNEFKSLFKYRQSMFDICNFLEILANSHQDDFVIINSEGEF